LRRICGRIDFLVDAVEGLYSLCDLFEGLVDFLLSFPRGHGCSSWGAAGALRLFCGESDVIVGVAGAGRSSGFMFGSNLQFAMIVGASGQTLLLVYVGLYQPADARCRLSRGIALDWFGAYSRELRSGSRFSVSLMSITTGLLRLDNSLPPIFEELILIPGEPNVQQRDLPLEH
jgi:hypothetical protein